MSKSTPITNLPNIKKQGSPAYEERENQLVKEILNEIDNENSQNTPQPGPNPEQQQAQQQQMMQQQMMEQQMMEQQMMEQQMAEQTQQAPANVTPELNEPKSMVDNIVDVARQPLIVALVCIVISIPQISSSLANLLTKNAKLAKYSTLILLLAKGVMGGGMYFGINKSLN